MVDDQVIAAALSDVGPLGRCDVAAAASEASGLIDPAANASTLGHRHAVALTSFAMINLRRDLHPQECAMLGAPKKAPAGPGLGRDKVGVPELFPFGVPARGGKQKARTSPQCRRIAIRRSELGLLHRWEWP